MKKRLRKKLKKGEFAQLGCRLRIRMTPGTGMGQFQLFQMAYFEEVCDAYGLERCMAAFPLQCFETFVCLPKGSIAQWHRTLVRRWLDARPEVAGYDAGRLIDANHDPWKRRREWYGEIPAEPLGWINVPDNDHPTCFEMFKVWVMYHALVRDTEEYEKRRVMQPTIYFGD